MSASPKTLPEAARGTRCLPHPARPRRAWLIRGLVALFAGALTACAPTAPAPGTTRPAPAPLRTAPPSPAGKPVPIVTPAPAMVARVASVNPNGRFVVLSYPLGGLPKPEQRLNVYRDGLKVGEVRVSRWQLDTHTVADIVAGDCRVGDQVRED